MPATRSSRATRRTPVERRARRGSTCALNMAFNSCGGPGSRITMRPLASSHSPGAVPRSFSRTVAPSGTMAWRAFTSDIARPSWRKRASILLITAGSRAELAAQQIGHGVARAIVFGGAEAAAGDHELDALARFIESFTQRREIVADHGLARDFDAQPVELRGEKKGIGVDPVRGQQFRSDCDDFSFHFELARKRKAFHFPIEGEERAAGGQDGAMSRAGARGRRGRCRREQVRRARPEKFARCRGGLDRTRPRRDFPCGRRPVPAGGRGRGKNVLTSPF